MSSFCLSCGARSGLDANAIEQAGASGGSTIGGAWQGGTSSSLGGWAGARSPTGGAGGRSGGAGDAGAPSTAGAAGAAGQRACDLLIDDMEDGSGRICRGSGRVGAWYEYNDGLGVQLPPQAPGGPLLPLDIPGGRDGSRRAMYSSHHYPDPSRLNTLSAWGAGIGVDLAFDGSRYSSYDARGLGGITFVCRSSIAKYFEVRVNTVETTPIAYGGSCPKPYCGAFRHGFWPNSNWTQQTVLFSELIFSNGEGTTLEFHPERLTNIQFMLVMYPTDSSDSELWVDDLRFVASAPPRR